MLSHGIPKALDYETLVQGFPDPLNVGTEMSVMLIVFAEVGCSILLLLGLFGRFASATLFVAMMVAAFVQKGTRPELSRLAKQVLAGAGALPKPKMRVRTR